jgi:hypothetical protein
VTHDALRRDPGAHRYRSAELVGDYGRAAAGLLLTAVPLVTVPMHPAVALAFAAAALLFAAFLLRTAIRHRTTYRLDEGGLTAEGPLGMRRIAWDALTGFRLRYFSTRRDRKHGWMQLRLTAGSQRLTLESALDDFAAVVAAAHEAALARDLPIDDATETNLLSLGTLEPKGGLAERWGVTKAGDD